MFFVGKAETKPDLDRDGIIWAVNLASPERSITRGRVGGLCVSCIGGYILCGVIG